MTGDEMRIVEAITAGASIDDASRQAGKPVGTVRRWLTEGRRQPSGKWSEFARAVDQARAGQRVELGAEAMSHPEVERILTDAIRRGSLQAVKLWLSLHQDGEGHAEDEFSQFETEYR